MHAFTQALPFQGSVLESQQDTENLRRKSLFFSFAKNSGNLVLSLYSPEKVRGRVGINVIRFYLLILLWTLKAKLVWLKVENDYFRNYVPGSPKKALATSLACRDLSGSSQNMLALTML